MRPAVLAWSATLACAAALVRLAGVVGCAPSLDDPQAFETGCPAGFSVDALLQSACGRSGCHTTGASAAAGLDLESAGAFDRMYGVASTCGPPLISASGPAASLLVAKLEGTAPCGGRMPLGGAPLSASDIACVEQWITQEIALAGPPPSSTGGAGGAASSSDGGFGGGGGASGAGGSSPDGGASDASDVFDASDAFDPSDGG